MWRVGSILRKPLIKASRTLHTVFIGILLFVPSARGADYNPVDVPNPGRLEGTVHFPGETPPPKMFANVSDHACPHGIAQNHLIVRQENLGLKNAIVILNATQGIAPIRKKIQLSTVQCTFEPRVQVATLGSSLELLNKDGATHIIEAEIGPSTEFTVTLSSAGDVVRRPLVHTGLYKVNCTRHLWERAWIYVSQGPYATVTDARGHYSINKIFPGRYEVRVWHEGWWLKRRSTTAHPEYTPEEEIQALSIRADESAVLNFQDLKGTFASD